MNIVKTTNREEQNMIRLIGVLFLATIIAVGGYTIYKGFTGDNDNAEKVADKASELVSSVADTFSDGAKEIAKEAKAKAGAIADSVKSSASAAVDSAKSTVKARIGDVREASKEKFTKAEETTADGVVTEKKKIAE